MYLENSSYSSCYLAVNVIVDNYKRVLEGADVGAMCLKIQSPK